MTTPSTEGYKPEWLELEKHLGSRPLLSGSPADLLEQFNTLGAALAAQSPPPDPSVESRDEVADGVPVRIYKPKDASSKLPLGVYFHGGGYVVGNLDSEDAWLRIFAKNTPCVIVSADYRLGPKHKVPTMLEDCVTAYKWAWQNAEKLGADQSKAFTIGSSAGGGLALTVADALISSGSKSQIQGVVAIVPVTAHPESIPQEYSSHYKSYTENASGVPIIDADTMKTFFEAVSTNYNDPSVFVTLSKNLAKFPKTYICTCGKDPLRDDGRVLEMMLQKEEVDVKSDHYEGLPHYWWMFPGFKGAEEFFGNVVQGIKYVLG